MIRAAVQTQRVTVFKDEYEDQDRHLGLLQLLVAHFLIFYHSLAKRPCLCSYIQGEPSAFVPCARINKCPCA